MKVKELAEHAMLEFLSGVAKEYKDNEIKISKYRNHKMTIELADGLSKIIIRKYRKNNELLELTPYVDFKRNGQGYKYYKGGNLCSETLYENDDIKFRKKYRYDGTLECVINGEDKNKIIKHYDFSERVKKIVKYKGNKICNIIDIDLLNNTEIHIVYDSYGTAVNKKQFVDSILMAEYIRGHYWQTGKTTYYDKSGNKIAIKEYNGYSSYSHKVQLSDIYKI